MLSQIRKIRDSTKPFNAFHSPVNDRIEQKRSAPAKLLLGEPIGTNQR